MTRRKLTRQQKTAMALERARRIAPARVIKIPIWEKRGQTFEQYQKRNINNNQ
jgi:hypothetical protein